MKVVALYICLGVFGVLGFGVDGLCLDAGSLGALPFSDKVMVEVYLSDAEAGKDGAQLMMALVYAQDRDIPKDMEKALYWYTEAAGNGNATAQLALGSIYFEGTEVERDIERSVRYLTLSAEQGNTEAQYAIGNMYYEGIGVDIDYDKAFKWSKLAAEAGDIDAQQNLGLMYLHGLGVEINFKLARKWLQKPAERGTPPEIQLILSSLYFGRIEDEAPNYEEAFKWSKKAADQGLIEAKFMLGIMCYFGNGVELDYVKARKCLLLFASHSNMLDVEQAHIAYWVPYINTVWGYPKI